MTTRPHLHPSAEMICDFARGALEPGRALVLRAHLANCPACRASLRLAEAVGGALIGELAPAEMASDAFDQVLARLEAPAPPTPPATTARQPTDWIKVPADVLEAAERHKRWAAPGVWVAPISHDRRTGARSYLLGVAAGMAVPRHTHHGAELVCVIKGAFFDGGALHGPGDFAESDDSIEHRPQVTRDSECVCLVAADAALVPRSWIGRLFQPIVGI